VTLFTPADAGAVVERLLNVFDPVMVKPPPLWFIVQLYVEPPPTNVLATAAVREITPVPVPAVVVNPVGAALLNAVVLALIIVIVPPLKVRFFVPVAVTNLVTACNVFPSKSTVPFVNVTVVPDNALPKDQLAPTPLKSTAPKATLLAVIVLPVFVVANVVVPEYVRVKFVKGKKRLLNTVNPIPDPASVITPSRPDAVMSAQTLGLLAIVTVKSLVPTFEFTSKNTLSDPVGTDAPVAPPEDADQLAVLVPSHVPVPPTQ
jgi:hypothetical protein